MSDFSTEEGIVATVIAAGMGLAAKMAFVTKGELDRRCAACAQSDKERTKALDERHTELKKDIEAIFTQNGAIQQDIKGMCGQLGAIQQYMKDHQ